MTEPKRAGPGISQPVAADQTAGEPTVSELAEAVLPPSTRERLHTVLRWVTGVGLGGFLGALIFLITIQGSQGKGFTDLDFSHSLGELVGGQAYREQARTALGVVGDSAGPTGLWVTIVIGIGLAVIHSLLVWRFGRGRRWYEQAVPLWILTVLLLGFLYMPLIGSRLEGTGGGVFGADAGGITPIVLILCALGFALAVARTYSFAISRTWWEPKDESLEQGLEAVAVLETEPSLELPEKRGEDRGVTPRG